MPSDLTSFYEQINQAQHQAMNDDPSMICMGLGIDDPKGIFNTTSGLADTFGAQRVFDMPTAENGMTGVGIGAAQAGTRVLMTHQRVDFFLLAMDQLVNNAAKWHYMFNGQMKVPLTIRLIVGRGWGQGPTHAQSLQSWFAHIPGLKVIIPSKTDAVGQQLYQAIMDDNPTVFIEHRWLHNQACEQSEIVDYQLPAETVRWHKFGDKISIIANSYMLIEALKAADYVRQFGVDCDVLEVVDTDVNGWQKIYDSVHKTGHVIVCDSAHQHFSVGSELVASITEKCFHSLHKPPCRLGLPGYPEPTSFALTKVFYNSVDNIVKSINEILQLNLKLPPQPETPHDVPGDWFKGPF